VSPQVSDEWRGDTNRRRRLHLFWPAAWYLGAALSVSAIAVFIAAYLVILFGMRGGWAWVVVLIALGSIAFAAGFPAAVSWIARRRRGPERGESRPSKPGEPVKAGAWSNTLVPNHDVPLATEGQAQSETRPRRRAARFQWLTLLAFIVILLALMLFFRSMWVAG
jgi:MFS family permease